MTYQPGDIFFIPKWVVISDDGETITCLLSDGKTPTSFAKGDLVKGAASKEELDALVAHV